jgi:hypothetical protein
MYLVEVDAGSLSLSGVEELLLNTRVGPHVAVIAHLVHAGVGPAAAAASAVAAAVTTVAATTASAEATTVAAATAAAVRTAAVATIAAATAPIPSATAITAIAPTIATASAIIKASILLPSVPEHQSSRNISTDGKKGHYLELGANPCWPCPP